MSAPSPRTTPTLPEMLASHERLLIVRSLALCGGSCARAAGSLGIRRQRLYDRIRKLGIDLGEVRAGIAAATPRRIAMGDESPRRTPWREDSSR